MSERAQELAVQFAQSSHAVIAFAEQCSVDDWRLITDEERWSVGVVCRHIARGFEVHPQLVQQAATGQPMPTGYNWDAIHESNANQAREWAGCTQQETLALLHRYRSEAVAVVRGLSDEQLERTVMPPLDNVRVSVQQIVEGMTDHPRAHLASLRATVSRQNVER
ncbi:MAG: DinB family protein [Chloroflexota bacterium]|nr:DinB family protein [Chloroflexota bacterium]